MERISGKRGLFGISVEFGASQRDLRRLVHDFAPVLRNLVTRLKEEKKGIVLVLDDINGLADSAQFANWLKSLVDEIATAREPLPLCLLLVGLEERRQALIERQPSLARVFDLVEIRAWSGKETRTFYKGAFSRVGMAVESNALAVFESYTGGLPVLAHEIGEAAFNLDTDGRIDKEDAINAILTAAEIVGRKYLQPQVFKAIRSKLYRSILRKLFGENIVSQFQRSESLQRLSKDETKAFDNFIRRMKDLGVIVQDSEEGPGAYRFANRFHSVYFWLEAQQATRKRL